MTSRQEPPGAPSPLAWPLCDDPRLLACGPRTLAHAGMWRSLVVAVKMVLFSDNGISADKRGSPQQRAVTEAAVGAACSVCCDHMLHLCIVMHVCIVMCRTWCTLWLASVTGCSCGGATSTALIWPGPEQLCMLVNSGNVAYIWCPDVV